MSDEGTEHLEPSGRDIMNQSLLSASTRLYGEDPLFHARASIAAGAIAYGCKKNGLEYTQAQYAMAVQSAAVALVLATVPDDELSESVDHAKVLIGMLEFERAAEGLKAKLAAERDADDES